MARPCLRSDLVNKAGRSQRGLRHSQWDMLVGTERLEREPVTSVVQLLSTMMLPPIAPL